jgi:hypothetical protein
MTKTSGIEEVGRRWEGREREEEEGQERREKEEGRREGRGGCSRKIGSLCRNAMKFGRDRVAHAISGLESSKSWRSTNDGTPV